MRLARLRLFSKCERHPQCRARDPLRKPLRLALLPLSKLAGRRLATEDAELSAPIWASLVHHISGLRNGLEHSLGAVA